MIQSSKIWGWGMACAAMFVATGAQAQNAGSGYVGYDSGSGGTIYMGNLPLTPQSPPVFGGDIQWSKNASSAYNLIQFTGSFFDKKVGIAYTNSAGLPGVYQQYVKNMAPATFSVDPSGRVSNGAFANELTWTGVANQNLDMTGGSFTLSNLHWNLLADGSAQVLATASGTGITTTTDVIAWTTPASGVTNGNGQLTLSQLYLSETTLSLWVSALGASPTGLTYASLQAAGSIGVGMGTLRVGVVPESATWLQMGLGLVGLGALLRRRKQG